ncbi:hypothetical protein BJ742DRAFT_468248 [Cladochytrium replicatum]|nr:hypothetical protein BJ742DRAFT_468248 [Cladochytrium replicatum]
MKPSLPLLAFLATPAFAWAPTTDYIKETYRGRNILFHKALNLGVIRPWVQGRLDVVSDLAIPVLDGLPTAYWVDPENNDTGTSTCALFHPVGTSVLPNINPEKQGNIVVFANCVDYTDQPTAFLHELAHAFEAFNNLYATIGDVYTKRPSFYANTAYRRVNVSPTCDNIDTCMVYGQLGGGPHYGNTNEAEYFAELTEAYFGINDYWPYTRPDLCRVDPAGCVLVETLYKLDSGYRSKWYSLTSSVSKQRKIWLVNNCNEITTVYWINYDGAEVIQKALQPGEIANFVSTEGHRFKIVPSRTAHYTRFEQIGSAPRQVYNTCPSAPVECSQLKEQAGCSVVNTNTQVVEDFINCPLRSGRGCSAQSFCRDTYSPASSCATWASQGECNKNPNFMLAQCRLSCKNFNGCLMG